jgi:hypothetical protein
VQIRAPQHVVKRSRKAPFCVVMWGADFERGRENNCFPVEEGLGKPWVSQVSRPATKKSFDSDGFARRKHIFSPLKIVESGQEPLMSEVN